MSARNNSTEYILVQKDGSGGDPLYRAGSLDEMAQLIELKGGVAADGSG